MMRFDQIAARVVSALGVLLLASAGHAGDIKGR
jgi:hypothetical protein